MDSIGGLMATITLEEALRKLEFLFEPERYPSYRDCWNIIREYALDGQVYRRSKDTADTATQTAVGQLRQADDGNK